MEKSFLTTVAGESSFGAFLTAATTVFMATFVAFYVVGLVPLYASNSEPQPEVQNQSASAVAAHSFPGSDSVALSDVPQLAEQQIPAHEPERIIIRSIGVDIPVLNPDSTAISVLDEALLSGSVRYPSSALAGQNGNVFIFGHTSHLPVVRNQMYKAFNRLPELEAGDTINIQGGGYDYIYRVTEVRHTDANEELVDLSPTQGRKLTLSTCDTFGAKSARWIVEAEFVGAYPTGSSDSAEL